MLPAFMHLCDIQAQSGNMQIIFQIGVYLFIAVHRVYLVNPFRFNQILIKYIVQLYGFLL